MCIEDFDVKGDTLQQKNKLANKSAETALTIFSGTTTRAVEPDC